jgi:3-dehydroquinate synthase
MHTIYINTPTGQSKVLLGEKAINFKNYLPAGKRVIIITDDNIIKHYPELLQEFPVVTFGLGEKNKTLQSLESVFNDFVKYEVDRSWFVLGIGGGIVCDVTGFAASSYMRGLPFGFISTTLLSQVDASVGGKNGVNFQGYKNMVGVFAQPEFVICDVEMLKTLDKKEFIAGFAEIIKAGIIRNPELFDTLEKHYNEVLNFDIKVLEKVIYEAVDIKARVVQNDEKEKGERRILNFGHTFAHSIEKNTGMLHGEAVSIGMLLATNVSVKLKLIQPFDAKRIESILQSYHLPTKMNIEKSKIYDALLKDKKREGEFINLVLINRIGNAVIQKVSVKDMEEIVNDLY